MFWFGTGPELGQGEDGPSHVEDSPYLIPITYMRLCARFISVVMPPIAMQAKLCNLIQSFEAQES